MTWEWSHTEEAYAAVDNIRAQPREWLEVVYAEWHALADRAKHEGGFNQAAYEWSLVNAKRLTTRTLARFIWGKADELRNCTNGGWEAHCCPFGCGCHMVPFDRADENEETATE